MKKTVLCLIAFVLCLLLCSCGINVGSLYPDADQYRTGDAEIAEKVEKIEINWASGSVAVAAGDGSTVQIAETANKPLTDETQLHYYLDGTTLRIQFSGAGWNTGLRLQKKLTVTIPKQLFLEALCIDTASADVTVTEIGAAEVELSSASGSLNGSLKNVGECELDTASGEIQLAMTGAMDTLEVDTASGAATITAEKISALSVDSASGDVFLCLGQTPDRCEIDTASGEISLALPENADFTARCDTASGRFDCDFGVAKKGDTYICGAGTGMLSFETASGNIEIVKK